MQKLLPIVVFGLMMAFLSDNQSRYKLDDHWCKKYLHKDKFFYFIMAVAMSAFVGLRTRGNDTVTYRGLFEILPADLSALAEIDWFQLSSAPGLLFLQILIKSLGASTQDYFMLTGFFVTFTYLWFIRKYTADIFLSVFYFITMGVYTFSMAAIKQTMAVAFLLLATDNAIQRKWIKFLFWVIIAELFHPYAFIYLVVPFLTFAPWTSKSYWLIAGTVIVALSLSWFMGAIDTITTTLGYTYDTNEFRGAGVNIFRVLVVWVTIGISFLGRNDLRCSTDREVNIIVNLAMMNAVIMFIGVFGTANYFGRLANYFLIFQVLALPWLFRYISRKNRKIVKLFSVIGYSVYCYYSLVVAQGRFDDNYGFISFADYLGQFLK